MLTKLLFPPQWIPTQPYLSVPSLTAFLKANKCEVEQMDINISFYNDILNKESLTKFYDRVYSKFQELDSGKELMTSDQRQYVELSSSVLFGDFIIKEVDNAKNVLKNRDSFYEIDELYRAFKILELGLKLISSAYYPSNLTFHSYDMSYSCRSSKDVLAALEDREQNLFIEYFEENTIPEVLKNEPGLVGISIINTSQLIPGLTLAHLIKKARKDIHINIGGSVFTRLIKELGSSSELFSVFDSVIVHEGETALLGLVKYLKGEGRIEDIPNLIYRDGEDIKVNSISSEGEDINLLPAPCFDGFPLEQYLSPELVLPVLSSRGCYWNRCTFCDHGYGYSGKYRPRDVELLFKDINDLRNKYDTRFFTFQDEGVAPKLISSLSDMIIENSLDISWLADSRFEPVFSLELGNKISRAGCKMIYFGLESANDRVRKCMDKGIVKENVLKICKYCSDAGIWTHLFLIFGFPTETRAEARETMDFILDNSSVIRSVAFGTFQLTKHSRVYENPGSFNVDISSDDNIDLSLWYDHEVRKGMSKRDADMVVQEFYNALSLKYRDFPIWGNLDREHLFLYIAHYGKNGKVADLSELINMVQNKKRPENTGKRDGLYPEVNEGIFTGTFNFNLAKLFHTMFAGTANSDVQLEVTNVLFDTNNNRIFTITGFGKDIIDASDGNKEINNIIETLTEKYQMAFAEADSKCRGFLQDLIDKNIVSIK